MISYAGLKRYQESLAAVELGLTLEPSNKALQTLKRSALSGLKDQEAYLVNGMRKFFK